MNPSNGAAKNCGWQMRASFNSPGNATKQKQTFRALTLSLAGNSPLLKRSQSLWPAVRLPSEHVALGFIAEFFINLICFLSAFVGRVGIAQGAISGSETGTVIGFVVSLSAFAKNGQRLVIAIFSFRSFSESVRIRATLQGVAPSFGLCSVLRQNSNPT